MLYRGKEDEEEAKLIGIMRSQLLFPEDIDDQYNLLIEEAYCIHKLIDDQFEIIRKER